MTAASGSSICSVEHETRTPMLPAFAALGPLTATVRSPPPRWKPMGMPVSAAASQNGSHASSHGGRSTRPASHMAVRRPPCAPAAPLRPPHESQRSLPQTQEGPSAVSTTFGARSRHCAGTRVCQRSFGSHWRSMWSSAEMIRYSIASSAYVWPLLVEKAPALVGELVEQRRRPPEITTGLLLERQHPVADI